MLDLSVELAHRWIMCSAACICTGMFDKFQPKFSKRYADVGSAVRAAVGSYVQEVC